MNLFTVIFEFNGGTYVSQVQSEDCVTVLMKWLKTLDLEMIEGLMESDRSQLTMKFTEEDNGLALLKGLDSVWCSSILWEDELQCLYIIKTTSSS